jgi:hypothetical protein
MALGLWFRVVQHSMVIGVGDLSTDCFARLKYENYEQGDLIEYAICLKIPSMKFV